MIVRAPSEVCGSFGFAGLDRDCKREGDGRTEELPGLK
jgi:hypothetical protein